MEVRNAEGYRVSLLNNDDAPSLKKTHSYSQSTPIGYDAFVKTQTLTRPYLSPRSSGSSPNTPELLRSDSYDSQMSNDPISPLTPSGDYSYPRGGFYGNELPTKRPAYVDCRRSASYEDEKPHTAAATLLDRPAKRYPCRYRDSHGCEKTFTTSGHASRHSKIHTAEKAVQCTHPGCQKKFTRGDNMKQHLETHFKDKSRSTGAQRGPKVAKRRESPMGRSRASPPPAVALTGAGNGHDAMQWESHAAQARPLLTPATSSLDVQMRSLPIQSRPAPARTPNSGLDALAMAVACQEESARY